MGWPLKMEDRNVCEDILDNSTHYKVGKSSAINSSG